MRIYIEGAFSETHMECKDTKGVHFKGLVSNARIHWGAFSGTRIECEDTLGSAF